MKSKLTTVLLIILCSGQANSESWSLPLTSTGEVHSTSLITDVSIGRLVPPIHVRNYNDGVTTSSRDLDVGDGRHGVFDSSTYANFSENGDVTSNIITINTDTYPFLQFTQFSLDAGWTIRPIGSRPLVIGVLGNVHIDGTIDCSGEDGGDLNADDSLVSSGGGAVCGGGAGGDGGTISVSAQNGESSGANTSGGQAGPSLAPGQGQGGGGGGSYGDPAAAASPLDGDDSLGGAGGLAGDFYTDNAFVIEGGGSGGGGGSVFNTASPEDSSGGGGGGGGGTILIVVLGNVNISATGQVLADGGQGGGNATGLRAGGGGGGGGGTVGVFARGDIINDGVISAVEGTGGATNAANGGDGGKGGRGRTWVVEKDILAGGASAEDPLSFLASMGAVRYKTGQFTLMSDSVDLESSRPRITNVEITADVGVSSSATVELSFGESADFTPDEWISNFSGEIVGQRYMRVRITVDNQSATTPATVSALSVNYERYIETNFNFAGGCGRVQGQKIGFWQLLLMGGLMILPVIFVTVILRTQPT